MNEQVKEKYILLVEDNRDDVTLTRIAIKKSQIPNKLVVVYDGEEALDFLFARGQYAGRDADDKPAVTLLDLKLPQVDGLEVLEQLRANDSTHNLPVVVLTSSSEEKDLCESQRLGADSFIRKPTGLSPLIEILQQIKSKWLS